mmetsp:Transcript_7914/g.48891  ORF Transcript_7914/g.48891 Transcript_7914/m.48891 type:complete len:258 (-) Transcript_7914:1533-2306(-)
MSRTRARRARRNRQGRFDRTSSNAAIASCGRKQRCRFAAVGRVRHTYGRARHRRNRQRKRIRHAWEHTARRQQAGKGSTHGAETTPRQCGEGIGVLLPFCWPETPRKAVACCARHDLEWPLGCLRGHIASQSTQQRVHSVSNRREDPGIPVQPRMGGVEYRVPKLLHNRTCTSTDTVHLVSCTPLKARTGCKGSGRPDEQARRVCAVQIVPGADCGNGYHSPCKPSPKHAAQIPGLCAGQVPTQCSGQGLHCRLPVR